MHPKALAHYQEGLAFQEQGDFGAARARYLLALELDARLEEARLKLIDVLLRLDDYAGAEEQARTLLDHSPNHPYVAYLHGVALSRLGRLGEAIGSFQRSLFIDPSFAPALEGLIAIYRQQGNLAGEIDMLGRLIGIRPENASGRFELADALVKAGRAAEAAQPLRAALEREPDRIQGYLLLAEIEGRLGNGEEAWKILQSVAGRAPDAPGILKALLVLCRQQATDAGLTNNPAHATQWWERLLAIAPDDPEALARLERLYTSQTRMGDLVRLMEQFAGHHPGDMSALLRLADALLAIGRKRDALFLFKQALQKHPGKEDLRSRAIELAMELDLAQEARDLVLFGRDASVLSAEERLRYAKAKALQGQKEEAWTLLEDILDDPLHGEAARLVGRNMSVPQAEDLGENPLLALKWWERALTCNPLDERAACEASIIYRQIDRGTDAVRVLRALPNRDKNLDLLREFAASCEAAHLYDEAHEAFTALAALEGDNPENLVHLIGLSLGDSQPGRAWSECEKLKLIAPDFLKLRAVQARTTQAVATEYEKVGNYVEAVKWWSLHVSFDPDSSDRKRLAVAQIATGDLKGAMITYRAWLRRHATDIEVAIWLGNYELEQGAESEGGSAGEAREYFELALDLRPNSIEALFGLARVAEAEGMGDEAIKLYQRILALEKHHVPAAMALARNAHQRQDDLTAWHLVKRILANNPDLPAAKALALAALKRLAANNFSEPDAGWWDRFIATTVTLEFEKAAQFAERIDWWCPIASADPERKMVAWCQSHVGDLHGAKLINQAWLRLHPDDIDLALELGNFQLEHGLYSDTGIATEAWAFFESVLELHPENVEALTGLARMAEAELDEDRSIAFYRLVLEVEPDNSEALKATAPRIKKAPPRSVDPNDPEDLVAFGIEQKLEAGALREAYEACEQFKKDAPDSAKLRPTQAKLALAMARACEKANNGAEAVKWWRQHVTFDPETSERKGFAEAQIATGDLNGAMLTFRAWLRRHPSDLDVAVWLGNYELDQGVYSDAGISTEAREYFEGVLEQDPQHVEGLYGLARVAEAELNDDEALELYRQIVGIDSHHIPSALALAHHHRRAGDDLGSWEFFQRVLDRNPDHPEARSAAVPLLKRLAANHPDESVWSERILALDPEDATAIKAVAKATTKRSDSTSSEVAKAFAEVLEVDPEDLEARLFLVQQVFDSGQLEEAQSLIQTAGLLELAAGKALGAQIAMALGDFGSAHQLLAALLQDEPGHPMACLRLAELAMAEGHAAKAWELVQSLGDEVLKTLHARPLALRVARHMAEHAGGENAIPYLEALLGWEPADLDARFSLAEIRRDQGHADQAIAYLQQILFLEPKSVRGALLAADLLSKEGNYADALRSLAALCEAGNEVASIMAGRIHQLSGNRAMARLEYERVIKHVPLHQEARMALAEFAAEEADGALAWHHLHALLAAQPQNQDLRAQAWRLLNDLAQRLEPETAISWWHEVHAFDREDLDLQATYATLLRETGQLAHAAAILETILERAPHQLDLALELGAYYRSEGLNAKARSAYGIAAQSGDPTALKALGGISRSESDWSQAVAWFVRAFERLPDDTALLFELAEMHFEARQFTDAQARLSEVSERWPDHPGVQALRLLLLRETARTAPPEEALEAWRTLSRNDPEDMEAHRELMRLALTLGAAPEEALQRIAEIDPMDAASTLALGLHLFRKGDLESARPLLIRGAEQGEAEAYAPLAQLEYQAGNDPEALSWLRLHLAEAAADAPAWRMRLALAQRQADAEGEWEALTRLSELGEPAAHEQRLALCNRQLEGREPREVLLWVERGFSLTPGPGELPSPAVTALGFHHQEEGRPNEALAAFLWAAEAQEPSALVAMARMAKAEGELAASARWLSKARIARPEDATLILELAEVLLADGALQQAYELLAPHVESHAQDSRARLLLQSVLHRLAADAQGPEAYQWLGELTRSCPDDLEAWRLFVEAADKQGRHQERDAAIERLSALDPLDLAAAEMLGISRLRNGRSEEASSLLERVARAGRISACLPAAEACLQVGELERAKGWLQAFEGACPPCVESLALRLSIARAEANAEAQWLSLTALEPLLSPHDAPTLRMMRLGLAWQETEAGRLDPWLDRALRCGPAEEELSEQALLELGQRYQHAQNPEKARQAYRAAGQRNSIPALVAQGHLALSARAFEEASTAFARALELEPDQTPVELALAEALIASERHGEAAPLLARLLAREGPHERAQALEATALREIARAAPTDQSLECWRSLSASSPSDLEAHREYLRCAQEVGAEEECMSALERLYRLDPADGASALELGKHYGIQGRREESVACLEAAAALGQKAAYAPLADLSFQAGDFDAAQEWLSRHLETSKHDPKAWRMRHAISQQHGDVAAEWEALSALETLGDPFAHGERLAMCRRQIELGEPAQVLEWSERGFGLAPRRDDLPGDAIAALGRHYAALGRLEEARSAYLWAAEARDPQALLALAKMARSSGDSSGAASWLERALETQPEELPLMRELAEVRLEAGEPGKAYEVCAPNLRRHPEDDAFLGLARSCLKQLAAESVGAQALHWQRCLVSHCSADLEAWRGLAAMSMAWGHHEEAAEARERVVALDPNDHEGALALGLRKLKAGKVLEAMPLLERAAQAGCPEAYLPAAEACLQVQNPQGAEQWLQAHEALALGGAEALWIRVGVAQGNPEAQWQALSDLESHLLPADTPTLRMARLGIAWQEIEGGRMSPWLDRALRLGPTEEELSPQALNELGKRYLGVGQMDKARHAFAGAANREAPEAMLALARLESKTEALAEAQVWYQKARQILDSPPIALEHAEVLAKLGQLARALDVLGNVPAGASVEGRSRELKTAILRSLADESGGEDAFKWWQQLHALHPSDPDPLRHLVYLANELEQKDVALAYLERLVAADPADAVSALALGQVRFASGQFKTAESFLRRAAEAGLADAFLPLSKIILALGEASEARYWIDAFESIAPATSELWECRRALATKENDPEAEWQALYRLAQLQPENPGWPVVMLTLCRKQFDNVPSQAWPWHERSVALRPTDPELQRLEADCLTALGQHDRAFGSYRSAYDLGDRHPKIYEVFLDVSERSGSHADSFQWARSLYEANPLHPDAYDKALHHARSEARNHGMAPTALPWWLNVHALASRDPEALSHIMHLVREGSSPQDSLAWAEQLLEIDPQDPDALCMQAEGSSPALEGEAARARFEALLETYPNHVSSLLALSRIERKMGQPEAALVLLDRIRQLEPLNTSALKERLGLLIEARCPEEAFREAEPFLAVRPDLAEILRPALLELARGNEGEGRDSEACAWWMRLLELEPSHVEGLRALSRLLVTLDRPIEALPLLHSLTKLSAELTDLQALAAALLAANRRVEARAIWDALARENDYLPAWRALGELELAEGHVEAAQEIADVLLQARDVGAPELAARVAAAAARALDPQENPGAALDAWRRVLAYQPGDPDALLGTARASAALGNIPGAMAHLELLLSDRPDRHDAKALLAECLLLAGDATRAEGLFQEVLAQEPDHPLSLLALARSSQARGEFVIAGDYCQRVLKLGETPEAERARMLAAYCARQLAEAARLRRDFDQAFLYADLLRAYQAPSLDLMRFAAELARDAGRRTLAAANYRHLLRSFPEAFEEGLQFARCYSEPTQAMQALGTLWEEEHPLAAAYALATLAGDQGKEELALEWWKKGLERAMSHPTLLKRAAEHCRRNDRFAEACTYFARLAEVTSYDPMLMRTWGSTALRGERYDLAREPFSRLAEDHSDRDAVLTLADILARLGEDEAAWEWAQRLLDGETSTRAEALSEQVSKRMAERSSDPETAIRWWERYLVFSPGDVGARLRLGEAHLERAEFDQALAAFSFASDLAPALPEPGWYRGETLRRMGKGDEARESYQAVLQENPRHGPSLFALAEMAWAEGDLQTVWELGQQLLQHEGPHPAAIELVCRCARKLALEAEGDDHWANAALYWELMLTYAPDDTEALEHLAGVYVHEARFAEAVGIQRDLVRLHPQDAACKFRLGEITAMGRFFAEARDCFLELRQQDPSSPETHQALAIVAMGLDEPMTAVQHYRDALTVAPAHEGCMFGLGRILMAEGQLDEAWDPLRKAVELSQGAPAHAEIKALARQAAERLSERASSRRLWDEAISYRRAALELSPADPSVRRALAQTCYEAGRKAEAIDELTRLLTANSLDHDASFLLGEIHHQSGDLAGARRFFQGILAQEPLHFQTRLTMAQLSWEAGEYDSAWNHLQSALATRPTHEEALHLLRKLALTFAERSQSEGDFPGAIRWWQEAWEHDKTDVELLRKIARAQVIIVNLSGAADTYGKILDADPKDLETAHILADIHRQRGDLRSAEGPLLRIVALDPRHVPSLRALMILARDRQNPPEALKRAYALLDVEPQNIEALLLLAWSHEQMMERRAALEVCKDILAIDPQHAEAYHTQGRLARDFGDFELAKKSLSSAIYYAPRAPYYHTMGTIYQALGLQEEALAAFGQALVLDPENADAHADLGLGLLQKAQPEKAKLHLQHACKFLSADDPRTLELQCTLDLIS